MPPGHFRMILKRTPAAPYKNFFWPTIPQRQASSNKQELTSKHSYDNRIIKDKL